MVITKKTQNKTKYQKTIKEFFIAKLAILFSCYLIKIYNKHIYCFQIQCLNKKFFLICFGKENALLSSK